MREILQQCDELRQKLLGETEQMMIERVMMRDIASARSRELFMKRDEEFRRIERWYESQKTAVDELFTAMISECEADLKKHDAAIKLLSAEGLARKDEGAAKPKSKPAAESAARSELQSFVSELEAKLDRLAYRDAEASANAAPAETAHMTTETAVRPAAPATVRQAVTTRRSAFR